MALGLTISARSKNKLLTMLSGIVKPAQVRYALPRNPVVELDRLRVPRSVDLEVFSPEEVMALVRGAECEQDAAIFLTTALTGLRRGEPIALRRRDVDFAACMLVCRFSRAAEASASRPAWHAGVLDASQSLTAPTHAEVGSAGWRVSTPRP